MPYQFKNLLEFCMMLGNNKALEDEVNLEIISWNDEAYINDSISYFEELQERQNSIKENQNGINWYLCFKEPPTICESSSDDNCD